MSRKKIRDLISIDVEEISIVDVPANRFKFLLTKRGDTMKVFKEVFKELTGEDIKDEVLEKVDEKEVEKLESNLVIIDKYKDSFPGELSKAVSNIVVMAIGNIPEENVEKVGAKLSKETINKLNRIISDLKSLVGNIEDDTEGKTEKADDSELAKTIAKLTEKVDSLEKEMKEGSDEEEITLTRKELGSIIEETVTERLR